MEKSVEKMINDLSFKNIRNRALLINDNQLSVFDYNSEERILSLVFTRPNQDEIEMFIDLNEKLVYQEFENDADLFSLQQRKQFLRYMIKAFMLRPDPEVGKIIQDIYNNLEEWTFDFFQPEG